MVSGPETGLQGGWEEPAAGFHSQTVPVEESQTSHFGSAGGGLPIIKDSASH